MTEQSIAVSELRRRAGETRSSGEPKYRSEGLLAMQEALLSPSAGISRKTLATVLGVPAQEAVFLHQAVAAAPNDERRRVFADAALADHVENLGGFERAYLNHAYASGAVAARSSRDDVAVLLAAMDSLAASSALAGELGSKGIRSDAASLASIADSRRNDRADACADLARLSRDSALIADAAWGATLDSKLDSRLDAAGVAPAPRQRTPSGPANAPRSAG